VVDFANTGAAVDLSRRASHVRAGQRPGRHGGNAALAATYGGLPDGRDPRLPLTDVQLVLGHAQLTTTQVYLTPRQEDVVRRVLAHHDEQARCAAARSRPAPAPGYRPESLDVLFGGRV